MDPDKIPFYLKHLGQTLENRLSDAIDKKGERERDSSAKKAGGGAQPGARPAGLNENASPSPRRTTDSMMEFEPDWEELDKRADMIIARYTVVSTASNVLPFGLDVVAVTAVFAKMTTELAGVYQVLVSNKRARQMGWAIATTTGTVLGVVFAGSRLAKLVPGGYFFGVLVQAPIVGAVSWAAGDALKHYFKQTRMGNEPSIQALQEAFAKTLRIRLKRVKPEVVVDAPVAANGATSSANGGATATAEKTSVSDAVEKIAGLHELMRAGAITKEEFEAKKADLLKQI
jgi:uncharacterized protein (DUF697 family)